MELSDYYDFSSSYGALPPRRRRRRVAKVPKVVSEEWEDMEVEETASGANDEEEDVEVVEDVSDSDSTTSDEDGSDYTDATDDEAEAAYRAGAGGVTFDPETFELVLPTGRRIGHRSLQRYYNQRPSYASLHPETRDLVPVERRSIKEATDQSLIPARGGFGDYGAGGQVVRARNKGEAKNVMKNPFRGQQAREQFKTRTGYMCGFFLFFLFTFTGCGELTFLGFPRVFVFSHNCLFSIPLSTQVLRVFILTAFCSFPTLHSAKTFPRSFA